MKSYKQIYQKLPDEFLDAVSAQYEPNDVDKILAGFMVQRPVTLRVNRIKTDVRKVMEIFRRDNIKFERVSWYEDALIIRNMGEKELSKHELYNEGHIYLQSLSSMLPPVVLKPETGSKVLDLTAAPGSKSTQLAALMGNNGYLLANEVNKIRAERLKFNVERQGADIIEVRVGDGKKLEDKWHEYFDFVLLDAPCSGVGLFSSDNSQSYRGWSVKNTLQLSREQKKLMETALWALKKGGTMVYSTCTLMREENEGNIEWALDKFKGEVVMEKINLKLPGVIHKYLGLGGFKDSMLLIFPSELYEGFFVSRFRKL
jgi:NOL1/NOP2/sun family putative RNA methylase